MSTSDDFTPQVAGALAAQGFGVPGADSMCVVVLDTSPWAGLLASAWPLLDAREQARAARFRFERDRSRYVLAHALWRVTLSACLDCPVGEVPLGRLPSGQPQLAGTGLSTSLSHSGDWVAVAVARAVAVGVDIECLPPRMSLLDMVDAICTADEAEEIGRLPRSARGQALLELWVRKEALVKAFGTGLRLAPTDLHAKNPVHPPPALGLPSFEVRGLAADVRLVAAAAAPTTVGLCHLFVRN